MYKTKSGGYDYSTKQREEKRLRMARFWTNSINVICTSTGHTTKIPIKAISKLEKKIFPTNIIMAGGKEPWKNLFLKKT